MLKCSGYLHRPYIFTFLIGQGCFLVLLPPSVIATPLRLFISCGGGKKICILCALPRLLLLVPCYASLCLVSQHMFFLYRFLPRHVVSQPSFPLNFLFHSLPASLLSLSLSSSPFPNTYSHSASLPRTLYYVNGPPERLSIPVFLRLCYFQVKSLPSNWQGLAEDASFKRGPHDDAVLITSGENKGRLRTQGHE